MDNREDLGALTGSRASTEPEDVSAASGFDPARMVGDHFYEFDHWETTYPKEMLGELLDDLELPWGFEAAKVGRLIELPPVWIANIPVGFSADGDADEFEPRAFPSLEWARQAYVIAMEAGTAETVQLGSVHDGAGPQDIAQKGPDLG